MAAVDESFCNMLKAYRSRDNYREVFTSTLNTVSSEVNLTSVKSCLTVGPGEGLFELGFIQNCAANIDKLTAVEIDHESTERLKNHLQKCLPNVEAQVIEADFCTWKGLDDPADLVLMFHMLYYFRPDERKQFLKKVHDKWLAADGFAVVVSASRTKSPGNANEIYERLGKPLLMWEDIEADLLEVGFIKQRVFEMKFVRDFSNPDESFLRYYQLRVDQPVTLSDVRDVIKELYPDGKSYHGFNTLAVFQRRY